MQSIEKYKYYVFIIKGDVQVGEREEAIKILNMIWEITKLKFQKQKKSSSDKINRRDTKRKE